MTKVKTLRFGSLSASAPLIFCGDTYELDFNGTSSQSVALNSEIVQLFATKDCYIKFDINPIAKTDKSNNSVFVPSGIYVNYAIIRNDKLAVIKKTADDGVLHITLARNDGDV